MKKDSVRFWPLELFIILLVPLLIFAPYSFSSPFVYYDAEASPPPNLEEVKFSYSKVLEDFPILFAVEKGFDKKHGLFFKPTKIETSKRALSLINGQIDFTTEIGTSLPAAYQYMQEELAQAKSDEERAKIIARGLPIRVVMVSSDFNTAWLMSRPEFPTIESIVQSQGVIGVNALNTFTHRYFTACLRNMGYDPASVKFVKIGGSLDRFQKLTTTPVGGKPDIAAVPLWAPYNVAAASLPGYGKLIGPENCPAVPGDGIVASFDKVKNNPEQVRRMVKVVRESTDYILDPQNKREVIDSIIRNFKLADQVRDVLLPQGSTITVQEYAERAYELELKAWSRSGNTGMRQMKELAELVLGHDKVSPEMFTDFSFVENRKK